MTEEQLWKAALGQLELRVSQGNFLTWFRHTYIKERSNNVLVVETENPFAYEWLSKKYQPLILEVVQGLDDSIQQIKFSVSSNSTSRRKIQKQTRIVAQKSQQSSTQSTQVATQQRQPRSFSHISTQAKKHEGSIPLNPKYTFDTFVVGPSNEIAHAACRAAATRPGEAYNPLFIYGGVGLGKTHLLQAIGNEILRSNPHFSLLYVASEKFANEFVDAIQKHTTQQFKRRYRNIDVLIIDDVQFFAGKDKTQEELFHTFNSLHGQNKQVILSSDRPPSSIPALQERLSSRLSMGMIADVKKPDYETRLAILREKEAIHKIDIDHAALEFIAKNIQSNVRELEGALNRVIAHSELYKQRATLEYAKKILKDLVGTSQRKMANPDQIIKAVGSYYNISIEDLCGKSRKKEIVQPRQIAMYLLRKESSMSFPSIGDCFSGRDHTTAMHACEKIEKLIEQNETISQEVNFLKERIYA